MAAILSYIPSHVQFLKSTLPYLDRSLNLIKKLLIVSPVPLLFPSDRNYSPTELPHPILLNDTHLLLSNPVLPFEAGHALLPTGVHHVAASTYMPNVSGKMIDWWFGWITDTEQYKLWHPKDHVYSEWRGPHGNSTYIGGAHLVHEYIGSDLQKLKLSFKSPAEYFGDNWEKAFGKAKVATAVCARVGLWDDPSDEAMQIGHVVHMVMEEWGGVRMRSRFWLGDVEGVESEVIRRAAVTESMAKGLLKHAGEEMAILGSILPSLYEKETGKGNM